MNQLQIALDALKENDGALRLQWGAGYVLSDLCAKNVTAIKALEAMQEQSAPDAYQYQARDGTWHDFLNKLHYESTVKDGSWPMRALYAAPVPAKPVVALTQDESLTLDLMITSLNDDLNEALSRNEDGSGDDVAAITQKEYSLLKKFSALCRCGDVGVKSL